MILTKVMRKSSRVLSFSLTRAVVGQRNIELNKICPIIHVYNIYVCIYTLSPVRNAAKKMVHTSLI